MKDVPFHPDTYATFFLRFSPINFFSFVLIVQKLMLHHYPHVPSSQQRERECCINVPFFSTLNHLSTLANDVVKVVVVASVAIARKNNVIDAVRQTQTRFICNLFEFEVIEV